MHDEAAKLINEHTTKKVSKDDLDFYAWPQCWESTSCGFGCIGGSAITTTTTVVFVTAGIFVVFHAGKFAYCNSNPTENFSKAFVNRQLPGQANYIRNKSKWTSEGGAVND